MHLQENALFDLEIGDTKHCPVPSTSCDLCTCKVWSCYVKWFSRRCIYKKIHCLTLTLVTPNIAQYPLHYVTYAPAKFEVATSNGFAGDAFTRKYIIWPLTCPVPSTSYALCTCKTWRCYVKWFSRGCIYKKIHCLTLKLVTQNIAQYPLHHVTYAPAKFEVATSNGLAGDAFTRKYIVWPWHWWHKHCPVPSTLCDLCTCKVWSCYVKWFCRRCIYKKIHYLTFDLPSTLYIICIMHLQNLKMLRQMV